MTYKLIDRKEAESKIKAFDKRLILKMALEKWEYGKHIGLVYIDLRDGTIHADSYVPSQAQFYPYIMPILKLDMHNYKGLLDRHNIEDAVNLLEMGYGELTEGLDANLDWHYDTGKNGTLDGIGNE